MTLKEIRETIKRRRGRKDQIESQIEATRKRIKELRRNHIEAQKARAIIQIVAQKTQEQIQYQLSDLGSAAMASIFPEPYEVQFQFEVKRNKVEADLLFLRDGRVRDPRRSGGGAKDLASLATRFSSWSISRPRTRPLFLLDEPLKFLKGRDLPRRGAALIKELSEKLGIQIIQVSHDPDLIDNSDHIIKVKMKRGVSEVE